MDFLTSMLYFCIPWKYILFKLYERLRFPYISITVWHFAMFYGVISKNVLFCDTNLGHRLHVMLCAIFFEIMHEN